MDGMDSFAMYYPSIYTKDQLQIFVTAGFIAQSVVNARFAEVDAAAKAQA